MKKDQRTFLFLSSILIILIFMPMLVSAADWTQFQVNTQRTGITSDKAPITAPETSQCWDTYVASNGMGGIDIVPLVVGDMVYVSTFDGSVWAYDKNTGVLQWTNSSSGGGFLTGNLAYGNGKLFVPTNAGKVHAFDAVTGVQLWNVTVSSGELNSPITFIGDRIYIGDFEGDNKYYCYDGTGTECWSRPSSSGKQYKWAGASVVGSSGDYLVFGDDGSYITSVNKNDGTTVDELNMSSLWPGFDALQISSSICYNEENNRIYFSSKAGYCYAVGMNPDGTFNESDVIRQDIDLASTSTPVVYNGRVYVGSGLYGSNGKFYCLNESDLSPIWSHTPNGGVQASPVISTAYDNGDGEIYIYFTTNSQYSKTYCLKDLPGNTQMDVMWEYQPPSEKNQYTLQGVSISNGRIFYGNDLGYLFSLATSESLNTQYVFADFTANTTSGDAPLTVQFNDLSTGATMWRWDVDGDGNTDYTVRDPVHIYDTAGVYNVTLTAIGSQGMDMKTKVGYINVDWNPWNNPESDGGSLITNSEIQFAVFKWKKQTPIDTGHIISNSDIQLLVFKWKKQTPM